MDKRELPIGIMDSGLGGLSVLKEALRLMPQEDFIYYGDSAHAPYGTKSTEEIRRLTRNSVEYLLDRGIKEVILACNTATSAAAAILREEYPELPIIGIEPALKPAVLNHVGGNILVTATELTLREKKFRHQLHCYEGKAHIYVQPLGEIVEFVEQGRLDAQELKDYLAVVLEPWTSLGLDAIVLGCTHFPFAGEQIRQVVGDRAELIDGAAGTAREAARQLERRNLHRLENRTGTVEICHSGEDENWLRRAEHLLYMD